MAETQARRSVTQNKPKTNAKPKRTNSHSRNIPQTPADIERQQLSDLFRHAPAMIGITRGPRHVYMFTNPLYLKVVGKTEAIIGKSVAQVFPELKGQGILEILDKVYETGKSYRGDELLIKLDTNNDGKTEDTYFNFVYQATKDGEGKINGILTHAIDVTSHVIARKRAEESKDYFHTLIEKSSDVIALSDNQGNYSYVSPGIKKVLGYTPSEFKKLNGFQIMHPDELDYVGKKFKELLERPGTSETIELRGKHKNGQWRWIEATATNLLNDSRIGAIVSNFRDINERKKAEAELKETRSRLESALAAGTIATWSWDIPGNRVIGDKNMAKFFGVPKARVVAGLPTSAFIDAVHQDDRAYIKQYVTQVVKSGKQYEAEYRLISRKGKVRWVIARGKVEYSSDGSPVSFPGVLVDITERKQSEERLRRSQERFALAQKAANIGTFEWNIKTGKILWTPELEALYGLPAGTFGGKFKSWLNVLHPDDRVKAEADLKRAATGKELNTEFRIILPDGTVRWIAARGRIFHDSHGKPLRLLGINRNVTKRKLAEERLQESEEQFRRLADSMPQIVWTARPDGYTDYYNKQWYDYTGLKEEYGDQSWEPILHPDDVQKCYETWYRSVETGEPYQIEYRFKDKSKPGKYRWFLGRALPIRNKSGKIIKWFGTCTDIDDVRRTLKRKDELEKITAALTEQRTQLVTLNEAKDEFISLASHQLRTPATGVKQYLGMVLEGYVGEFSPEQRSYLNLAYESNERQINIVNDLLQVAQVDSGKVILEKEDVDLAQLTVSVILEQFSKFSDRKQKINYIPPKRQFIAHVDKRRIRMVIENIIDNASKYTPEHKNVYVSITRSAGNINIAIKDEGVGIKQDETDKIFDKFSRLDNPLSISVGGTGLGLYWVKKIINLHGGKVEVTSRPGNGSTFTIIIPLAIT